MSDLSAEGARAGWGQPADPQHDELDRQIRSVLPPGCERYSAKIVDLAFAHFSGLRDREPAPSPQGEDCEYGTCSCDPEEHDPDRAQIERFLATGEYDDHTVFHRLLAKLDQQAKALEAADELARAVDSLDAPGSPDPKTIHPVLGNIVLTARAYRSTRASTEGDEA